MDIAIKEIALHQVFEIKERVALLIGLVFIR